MPATMLACPVGIAGEELLPVRRRSGEPRRLVAGQSGGPDMFRVMRERDQRYVMPPSGDELAASQ
jgi:hypothetical protein